MANYEIGLTGLNVAQRAIEIIGTNIANVSTAGYHRQTIKIQPVTFDTNNSSMAGGAKVDGVHRSIDVLLESAASSLGDGVIAIILTGTSADGARGLRAVRAAGGIGWVQAPETAQSALMPQRAIEVGGADAVLSLPQIAQRLARFAREMPQ